MKKVLVTLAVVTSVLVACKKENYNSDMNYEISKQQVNSKTKDTPYIEKGNNLVQSKVVDTPYINLKIVDTPYISLKIVDTPYFNLKVIDTPYKIIDTPYKN